MYFRLVSFCSLLLMVHCTNPAYYWRDYYGEIPRDALPSGVDKNNHLTYIGQVFIPDKGLFPGQINAGIPTVGGVVGDVVYTSDVCVKILCTQHPESFEWLPATAKDVQVVAIGKNLVLGGTEGDNKVLNIGRIFYQSEVIVGKIITFNSGFANMHFAYNGKEHYIGSFQVLTHNANLTRLVLT